MSSGPFGISMGMRIDEIDSNAEALSENLYVLESPPKRHPQFDSYFVEISEKTGVCWIKAITKNIVSSSYGIEINSVFQNIMSRIKNTYGDCLDFDFVLAESIWQDDNDWMMGLLKQERILKAYWNEEHNSKMKNNLVDIILYAVADSADEGYIAIEYIFSNFEQHKVEQQQQEDEAL